MKNCQFLSGKKKCEKKKYETGKKNNQNNHFKALEANLGAFILEQLLELR